MLSLFRNAIICLMRTFPFMLNPNGLGFCCLKPKGLSNTNIFGSIRSEAKLINSFKMILDCEDKDCISQLRFPSRGPGWAYGRYLTHAYFSLTTWGMHDVLLGFYLACSTFPFKNCVGRREKDISKPLSLPCTGKYSIYLAWERRSFVKFHFFGSQIHL